MSGPRGGEAPAGESSGPGRPRDEGRIEVVEADGRRVRLTNLQRVLWPATGDTKGDLLAYYREVAPALLPHLVDRPVTLWRYPEGVDGPSWFQNECRGRPNWMATVRLPDRRGGVQEFCLVNDLPSLLWVANLGTVELHPFLARADRPDRPTAVVFDLDPGAGAGLAECSRVALRLRDALARGGLDGVPKTSGGKGLHVVVPLNAPHSFQRTKAFARAVAGELAGRHPGLVVDRMARSLRRGRVLVDWSQNDPGKSTIAVYSLRGTSVPRVSTPVTWEEVEGAAEGAGGLVFGPREVLDRLARHGDLFAPVLRRVARLPGAPR